MIRALLAVYWFPPAGGGGVQRGVKLCRHLPEAGVEPTVITVESGAYSLRHNINLLDSTMIAEVPSGLRVIRTPSGDDSRLRSALRRAHLFDLAWRLAPRRFFEPRAGWYGPLVRGALEQIGRDRPDVLVTSSPPNVVHVAGARIRDATRVPWIADFRDPWANYLAKPWPSRGAMLWEARREAEVVTTADAVVANTPGQRRDLLERYPHVAPERIAVVPNGYDPADFDVPPAPRPVDEIVVVHAGTTVSDPPGKGRRAVKSFVLGDETFDRSTQSFEPLLLAVAALRRRRPRIKVRVRLVGPCDDGWRARAEELGIGDCVEFLGYRPHREATSHVLAADLLYLSTVTRRDGRPQTQVPGKTYEYLGSGRPIVAMTRAGDVRDLMSGRPRCTVLDPDDSEGLADVIERTSPGAAARDLPPDPPDARPWRRREQALDFGRVVREVAARFARSP